jgi:hypothetical protein
MHGFTSERPQRIRHRMREIFIRVKLGHGRQASSFSLMSRSISSR